MAQPEWEEVGHIGDVNWAEHGGGPVLVDRTGVYAPELEYVEPPTDDLEFSDPNARWMVYRVALNPEVPSWGDINDVARSIDSDPKELAEDFVNPDPMRRASAYWDWAGYYGWHEFDTEPLTLTCAEMNKRYDADLDCHGEEEEEGLEEARGKRKSAAAYDFLRWMAGWALTQDVGDGWLVAYKMPSVQGESPGEPICFLRQATRIWHVFYRELATGSGTTPGAALSGGLGDAIGSDREMRHYCEKVLNAPRELVTQFGGLYAAQSQCYAEMEGGDLDEARRKRRVATAHPRSRRSTQRSEEARAQDGCPPGSRSYMARYVHQISPKPTDVGGPFCIRDGAWSDRKTLGAALRKAGVLDSGARVREFRVEGEDIIVFPSMPGMTTYWHAVVLTPND